MISAGFFVLEKTLDTGREGEKYEKEIIWGQCLCYQKVNVIHTIIPMYIEQNQI